MICHNQSCTCNCRICPRLLRERELEQDDPLGAAKGILRALLWSLPIWGAVITLILLYGG